MGGLASACKAAGKAIFKTVKSIIAPVRNWLKTLIQPKTRVDVMAAESIIVQCVKPETTTQYITANREKAHIDTHINEVSAQMTPSDKQKADAYLNSFKNN
jgi:hypothetical protein